MPGDHRRRVQYEPGVQVQRSRGRAVQMRVRELIRIHIDHISDDNARLSGCAFIYGQDVLPENADKEDLDGAE